MENKVELKIVGYEWKSGVKKETGKEWVGLQLTLQGSEKYTVNKILFLQDMHYQLLGLEKPAKA